MKCPKCGHSETSVLDTRVTREGREIRRRRACKQCNERFTTYERLEERTVYIIKKDKRREPFNKEKIIRGMRKACDKLDIPMERLEKAAQNISRKVYDLNMDEIKGRTVGRFVMQELSNIDEVAYIRFASVYLRFKELSQYTRHIEEMRQKKNKP